MSAVRGRWDTASPQAPLPIPYFPSRLRRLLQRCPCEANCSLSSPLSIHRGRGEGTSRLQTRAMKPPTFACIYMSSIWHTLASGLFTYDSGECFLSLVFPCNLRELLR